VTLTAVDLAPTVAGCSGIWDSDSGVDATGLGSSSTRVSGIVPAGAPLMSAPIASRLVTAGLLVSVRGSNRRSSATGRTPGVTAPLPSPPLALVHSSGQVTPVSAAPLRMLGTPALLNWIAETIVPVAVSIP